MSTCLRTSRATGRHRSFVASPCVALLTLLLAVGGCKDRKKQEGSSKPAAAVTPAASAGALGDARQQARKAAKARRWAGRDLTPKIAPGSEPSAEKYYERIGSKLNLPLVDAGKLSPKATIDQLVEYAGFAGLSAAALQNLDSKLLMPKSQAEFEALGKEVGGSFLTQRTLVDFADDKVLVSRFFAPKIVDYTQLDAATATAHYKPGWRKLVRLRVAPDSKLGQQKMDSVYLLFNFVEGDPKKDPFKGNLSKNNQVIILPKTFGADEDSAFFLVYGELPKGLLVPALDNVAFDLPDVSNGKYFVPDSCAQCHGHDGFEGAVDSPRPPDGIYRKARVNYLDTDQWHDALNFDFPQLVGTSSGVVFDGGTDPKSAQYHEAMEVLRKLNQGALDQVTAINSGDFKYRAAAKWLALHQNHDEPVPFTERSLGATPWDMSKPDEKELLGLLDHYCFRCHSSLVYNVFDRDSVHGSSFFFEEYLGYPRSNPLHMPQGRTLPVEVKDRIVALTNAVFP